MTHKITRLLTLFLLVSLGGCTVQSEHHVPENAAFCGSTIVALTQTELRLLSYMMKQPEKAYSREELLSAVWGFDSEVETRVTDETLRRIRKKLLHLQWCPCYVCMDYNKTNLFSCPPKIPVQLQNLSFLLPLEVLFCLTSNYVPAVRDARNTLLSYCTSLYND